MAEHPYAAAWRDLERRETILKIVGWLALPLSFVPELSLAPLVMVAFAVFDLLHLHALAWQISLAVVVGTLLFVAILAIVASFRCPRCRKLFFFKRLYFAHDPNDKKRCVHCGLDKGALPEVSAGQVITAP